MIAVTRRYKTVVEKIILDVWFIFEVLHRLPRMASCWTGCESSSHYFSCKSCRSNSFICLLIYFLFCRCKTRSLFREEASSVRFALRVYYMPCLVWTNHQNHLKNLDSDDHITIKTKRKIHLLKNTRQGKIVSSITSLLHMNCSSFCREDWIIITASWLEITRKQIIIIFRVYLFLFNFWLFSGKTHQVFSK